MSFAFPKPVPESRSTSSSVFDSDFDINEYYHALMEQRGPDYDELIIPLSVYAYFNRPSPSEQPEEIRRHNVNVDVEDSDFTEKFKKLNYSNQQKFLSNFLQKFKRGRLICSFKQLDTEHQQQLIESMNHLTPEENFRDPGETEEEFRLRRFAQLCRDHTRDVQKLFWRSEDEEKDSSDWKSSFFEFFLNFSIIWFKGQWASGQDMLIEQLSKGVRGVTIEEQRLQDDENEEDFKLRRFTELCKKIVDFRVQEKFLDNAEKKLEMWGSDHFRHRLILEPQDSDSAAALLSDLSTLGCSLLSTKYQRHKIEEMSNLVEGGAKTIEESADDEENFGVTRFTELFNQVPVPRRINLFRELRKILLKEKPYSEAVRFFRGLGSEVQTEMIEELSYEIITYNSWEKFEPAELIIEKFSGESEEDFRLRRFKKVCSKHLSTCGYIIWPDADEERVRRGTSDNYEESLYAKFLFDASITWFKARCGNYRRNPIHVILFGYLRVEFRDHVIEKLPEESEEDFRLRRFTESFKQLDFTYQVRIVDYIQHTLFRDLGHSVSRYDSYDSYPDIILHSARPPSEGRNSFDSEWIKMKLPDLQDQGAAVATTRGATTTTQAGQEEGRGQVPQPSSSA